MLAERKEAEEGPGWSEGPETHSQSDTSLPPHLAFLLAAVSIFLCVCQYIATPYSQYPSFSGATPSTQCACPALFTVPPPPATGSIVSPISDGHSVLPQAAYATRLTWLPAGRGRQAAFGGGCGHPACALPSSPPQAQQSTTCPTSSSSLSLSCHLLTGDARRALSFFHQEGLQDFDILLLSGDGDTLYVGAREAILALDIRDPGVLRLRNMVRRPVMRGTGWEWERGTWLPGCEQQPCAVISNEQQSVLPGVCSLTTEQAGSLTVASLLCG